MSNTRTQQVLLDISDSDHKKKAAAADGLLCAYFGAASSAL